MTIESSARPPTPDDGWQPVARTRTYELVIDAVEDQILAGTLKVGDALPPERELAAKLQVSRPAVREAMRVLEAQGMLRSATGSGSGAGTFVAAMPGQALSRFLRLHIALANFEFAEIVEARVTLECSSVALAARATDPDRLVDVRAALTRMAANLDDREQFNDDDTAFHTAIARAGGNRLVTALTVAIRNALRASILDAFQEIDDWTGLRAELMTEHRAILAAIEAGDADHAVPLAEQHIRDSYERLPLLHKPLTTT